MSRATALGKKTLGAVGRRLLAAGLAAGLFVAACSRSPEVASGPAADAWPELQAVPHPELSSVEAGARGSLDSSRVELRDLRSRRQTPPHRLAQAFGRMADLYQAYGLDAAADACYGNARSLQPEEPRWAYSHGLLQARAGRLEDAQASFAEVSGRQPGNAAARLRRGEALLSLGRAPEARENFEAAFSGGEAFEAAALFGIGRAQAALGEWEEAAASLGEVRRKEPQAGVVRYPLARTLQKLGRSGEAEAVLAGSSAGGVGFPDPVAEEIRELAASSAALVARGGEALVANRLEEAEDLYRRAMTADPSNIEARRNLAVALSRATRDAEAVVVLEAAQRLAPDHALIAFDLANARLAAGDLEGAVTAFKRSLSLSPDLEAAHFNLANALMQSQNWEQAEGHLRRVIEIAPDNLQASYLLAMARYQQGHRQEGQDALRQVLAKDPSMTAARMSLASILSQTGRLEQARRHYVAILEQPLAAASERAAAYTQLAGLSIRRRSRAEAESQLQKALEIQPGDEEASAALVELLKGGGRLAEAREVAEAWARERPRSPRAHLAAAQTRIAVGAYREARQGLEEALAHPPVDSELLHLLARILATAPDSELRDGARALSLAQQAYIAQRSLDRAETIAMAMAESGDFAEAVRWQKGLMDQARGMGNQELVRKIGINLKFYEAGRAVRSGSSGE